MEIIKYILFILIFTLTTYPQEQKNYHIEKNEQGGFNIYNSSGELLQEISPEKTDSITLKTLENIFSGSDTLYNDKEPIVIFNLQGNTPNWMFLVLAIVGIFGAVSSGYFINKWNKKAQIEQFQKQTKIQLKKEWSNLIITYVSEYITETITIRSMRESIVDSLKLEEWEEFYQLQREHFKKIEDLEIRFESILDKSYKEQSELLSILRKISKTRMAFNPSQTNIFYENISKAKRLTAKIYQNEMLQLIKE